MSSQYNIRSQAVKDGAPEFGSTTVTRVQTGGEVTTHVVPVPVMNGPAFERAAEKDVAPKAPIDFVIAKQNVENFLNNQMSPMRNATISSIQDSKVLATLDAIRQQAGKFSYSSSTPEGTQLVSNTTPRSKDSQIG